MTEFHHAWLAELHATLERSIERVQRTQKHPQSAKHREALMRVRDARHALMRFEQSA